MHNSGPTTGRTPPRQEHRVPPVVRLFTFDAGATWLLIELNLEDEDTALAFATLASATPDSAAFP
jgi:hypothetical protein